MKLMTIGELAKQAGLKASALRYYEAQGLLHPVERSEGGYRLFDESAKQVLNLIQRAQRLGFALEDIRVMLDGFHSGRTDDEKIVDLAEERFVTLERQLTEQLILRHEMRLFLVDLYRVTQEDSAVDRLFRHVCSGAPHKLSADSILDWLIERTGCALASVDASSLMAVLQGQHSHIWQEHGTYHILFPTDSEEVLAALESLAELESACAVHSAPDIQQQDEGILFSVSGENAFVFAQLFLALERAD